MSYVDGFVLAVPVAKKQQFVEQAKEFAKLFKEYGATHVQECWGDDVPDGKLTDFKRAVKAEDGEVIVFSWVQYPSKAVRDAANAKMRDDDRMKNAEMPFDGKRMIFGGFIPVVDE